jgi:hypothetical protein
MRCLSRFGRGAEKALDCGCVAPGSEVGGIPNREWHASHSSTFDAYARPNRTNQGPQGLLRAGAGVAAGRGRLIREAKRAGGLLIDLSAWF